jgi:CheY-like chemotaxis protein
MSEYNATVLIVEDNDEVAELLACMLTHAGIHPVLAANGIAGLHQAQALLPSLVLCDSCMPRMDGLQVLEAMRSNPSTARIPFVLMSGNDVARYRNAGATALLQKPFPMMEMLTLVRRLIYESSAVPSRGSESKLMASAA